MVSAVADFVAELEHAGGISGRRAGCKPPAGPCYDGFGHDAPPSGCVMASPDRSGQRRVGALCLTLLERPIPQVFTIKLQQIESIEEDLFVVSPHWPSQAPRYRRRPERKRIGPCFTVA
jgi:hypothetical protein